MLVGIELAIDVLDFLIMIVTIETIIDVLLAILDLVALFALYLFFTAGKVMNQGGTENDVWKVFKNALIYLIIVEGLYGVVLFISPYYVPTILYWITLILPIISLILVNSAQK